MQSNSSCSGAAAEPFYASYFPGKTLDKLLGPLNERYMSAQYANGGFSKATLGSECALGRGVASLFVQHRRNRTREFTFDYDLSDYDSDQRRSECACSNQRAMCAKCWQFAACAIRVMDHIAREVLDARHVVHFFSGRRGAHTWILDERFAVYSSVARETVVCVFQREINESDAEVCRICAHHYQLYYGRAPATEKIALDAMYPRIDVPVFVQLEHKIRCPLTPHRSTGRIVWPVDPLRASEFDPGTVPTAHAVLNDTQGAQALYNCAKETVLRLANRDK